MTNERQCECTVCDRGASVADAVEAGWVSVVMDRGQEVDRLMCDECVDRWCEVDANGMIVMRGTRIVCKGRMIGQGR